MALLAEVVAVGGVEPALDGLWYASEGSSPPVVVSHGNTMNFYTGAPRFLPPALVPAGFACLAFNRRGHDVLSTRDSRLPVGGAFQTAGEGLADTAAAVAYARGRTGRLPVLAGHSNGGMLAAAYAAGAEVAALVLLSAHAGGRDTVARSCAAGQLAAGRVDDVTAEARRLVAEGRGDALLLLPGWWYVISAASFLDRLERTPDLLASAEAIRCPSLFVVGDDEDPDVYPARAFAERAAGPCEVVRVPGDHFYRGCEERVAAVVTEWLHEQVSERSGT